jgi:hypothetical protein
MLVRSTLTHVAGDDADLYLNVFAGRRASVVLGSGRVLASGFVDGAAAAGNAVRLRGRGMEEGGAPSAAKELIAVPFRSPARAATESKRIQDDIARRPCEIIGSSQRPAALPSSRPPLAELVTERLRHVTDLDGLGPEACFHLAVALAAAPKKRAALRGFVLVPLPENAWVLYRITATKTREPVLEAEEGDSPRSAATSFAALGAAPPVTKVVSVGGPVPMLVWRDAGESSPSGSGSQDRGVLLAGWMDPVLTPSVPCKPEEALDVDLAQLGDAAAKAP